MKHRLIAWILVLIICLGAIPWAAAAGTSNPFTDVSAASPYYPAILWAYENGITGGTSPTTFSPNNTCTRAQIVTFLYRALA